MREKSRWLLLLYALPTRRNAERVSLWRKLRKCGAVPLKSAGYLLPDSPIHLERFQWLSQQIRDAGGEATVIRVAEIDGVPNPEVVGLFNDARAADYRELAKSCRGELARRTRSPVSERPILWSKLRQRFGEIRQIDYFHSSMAHDVEMLLDQLERAMDSPRLVAKWPKLDARRFVGRTWLTRPRPGIDRAGSAWLIRKFVDPKARFVFDTEATRRPAAIPFDMAGGEFTHQGEDCTFETLVKRFGIKDPAVQVMAEMVHDADLEDRKFRRVECIGMNRVLEGWARTDLSDGALLAKGMECFEGLYCELKSGRARSRDGKESGHSR